MPLKITSEVKQVKNDLSLEEAVAMLKMYGLDELLAFYLKRYPIERDDEDAAWADQIDVTLARSRFRLSDYAALDLYPVVALDTDTTTGEAGADLSAYCKPHRLTSRYRIMLPAGENLSGS